MKADFENEGGHGEDVPFNAKLPKDVIEMLRKAKAVTGRSHKHLLTEAIRTKYAKYLKEGATVIG